MSFIKIIDSKIEGNFFVGSAVKITVVLSEEMSSGGTITIDIEDPSETSKVSDGTMTEESASVFSYTYNNTTNDDEGTYTATITITYGTDTIIQEYEFDLIDSTLTD